MEMQDDFESLLKGAAGSFGEESLSEQALSEIIDDRLIAGRNRLKAEFRKELLLIALTLCGIIYLLIELYKHPGNYKPQVLQALRVAIMGGIVYMIGSIILFLRLVQVAKQQKDMGIRGYIKEICRKTERALGMYLWISTIASTATLVVLFVGRGNVGWYWVAGGTVLMGAGMYYLNRWYTDRRFGQRLKEMKGLLAEFE